MLKTVAVGGAALGATVLAARQLRGNGWHRSSHTSESPEEYERARTRILILGAGFGGMATALRLDRALADRKDVSILLVDRGNTQLFYPLLWTVADGRANAESIAVPLRTLQRGRSFHLLHADIEAIDVEARTVRTSAGARPYDMLVIALGSTTTHPNIPGLTEHALLFHSAADAVQLRNHVIDALEKAHQSEDPQERQAWLTFVVGGGGDTGCELAATIQDYITTGLLKQYPWLADAPPRVIVVEQASRLMPLSSEKVATKVQRELERAEIEMRLGVAVQSITDTEVQTSQGTIPARTMFWAAGTTAPDLVRTLPLMHARNGALVVDDHLRAAEHPEIYVVGDAAWIDVPAAHGAVPPTAQAAEQEGAYCASVIAAQVRGEPSPPPFHYSSKGHFTLLGRHSAVDEVGPLVLTGLPAWLLWHAYYLQHLPSWRSRVHLATDWLLAALMGRETGQILLQTHPPTRMQGKTEVSSQTP